MELATDPQAAHTKGLMLTMCFHADVIAVFSLEETDSHSVMRDVVRGPCLCNTKCYICVLFLFAQPGFPLA